MRPPRYRFPDEVRSTTRMMASRMVQEGTVPETPEELDAWIARAPEVRATLEDGGYGTEFTAHDLFPLLEVFVAKAGGPAPRAPAPPAATERGPASPSNWFIVGLVLVLAVVLLVVVIVSSASP